MSLFAWVVGLPALEAARIIKISDASALTGTQVTVSVQMTSDGDENAVGFSINFPTSQLSVVSAVAGSGLPVGTSFLPNLLQTASGRIGIAFSVPAGQTFSAGTFEAAKITFNVGGVGGAANLTFGNTPIAQEVVNATANPLTTTFTPGVLQVTKVNSIPTINTPANLELLEDGAAVSVNLAGITSGTGDSQVISVTASVDNPAVVSLGALNYTSPSSTGTLSLSPVPSASGSAIVTLTVKDDGGVANGGVDTKTVSFSVTVLPVNDAPTLGLLTPVSINEDAPPQLVQLSGIGSGAANENQNLIVTAESSNPGLIPSPTVSYTSPASAGSIQFTPVPGKSGNALITVTVKDDGGVANGGQDTFVQTIPVVVHPVNDQPLLNPITSITLNEDAGVQSVALSGINSGSSDESQILAISAVSSNPGLIPDPSVTYTSPADQGSLSFTPVAGASGTATITVTLKDNGGTANGGQDTLSRTFEVTVNSVNDQPTINPIANVSIDEDAPPQTIQLTGIGSGAANENQVLSITAKSSDARIFPDPTVTYVSPSGVGSLSFKLATQTGGTATVTVTVFDDGGTANGGVNSKVVTFQVNVAEKNDPPRFDVPVPQNKQTRFGTPITFPIAISDFETAASDLIVEKMSSNESLVPVGNISITGTGQNRSVTITPAGVLTGVSTITLKLTDTGATGDPAPLSTSVSFDLTVVQNELPTITALASQTVNEDGTGAVQNFSIGDLETAVGSLQVTVSSSNPTLIPVSPANLGGTGASRTVQVSPVANGFGSSEISVQVKDADNGVATSTFLVTVNPVNDQPTLDSISAISLNEDAATQNIPLTGISTGAGNESQALILTAKSSNASVVPDPVVVYSSPGSVGQLQLTPVANASGSAVITVTLKDDGGTANGGSDTLVRTFNVTVVPVNDKPVVTGIVNQSIDEDTATPELAFTISDIETAAGSLNVTASSSNSALVPQSGITLSGSGGDRKIKITPAANAFGASTITITVTDGNSESTPTSFVVNVASKNDLPSITAIGDVTISRNTSTSEIGFSISDIETGASTLTVTPSSSNVGLIPLSGITIIGTGAERKVKVTPAVDQIGVATVTLTVSDSDGGTAVETFVVTVIPNAFPVISDVPDQNVDEDKELTVSFTVSDAETQAGNLQLSFEVSSSVILPAGSVTFGGTGGNRTATIKPARDLNGTVMVTLKVSDAEGAVATDTFLLLVKPINDGPVIGSIKPESIVTFEGFDSAPTEINVSDIDTAVETLKLTAVSDSPSIFLSSGITITGNGAVKSLVVKPLPNAFGNGSLTLTLSDGEIQVTRKISVRVDAVNNPPSIGSIPDTSIQEDSSFATVLDLRDPDTRFDLLNVSVTSSDSVLFPPEGVGFQIENRRLVLRPAANRSGTARITVMVSDDGGAFSTTSFNLTVVGSEDAPTISKISDQKTLENKATTPIAFTISDPDTALASLVLSSTADNQALIPPGSGVFAGTGTDRTLILTPGSGQSGEATVTVSVSDGVNTVSTSFLVKVDAVNDLPEISDLADVLLPPGTSSSDPVTFIVSDPESPTSDLKVGVSSSNTALLPEDSISITGTGFVRTLVVRPVAGRNGQSVVTLTVRDPQGGEASTKFTVTVQRGVNQPPQITLPRTAVSGVGLPVTVPIAISDPEDGTTGLKLAFEVGNPTILPPASQVLSGTGGARSITLTAAGPGSTFLRVTVTDTDGATAQAVMDVAVTGPSIEDPFTPSTKDDFSGDGLADLLLQDSRGLLAAWFLRGNELIGGDFLIPGAPSEPAWRVVATGNFGGDAGPDVLFQHSNGLIAVWIMDGIKMAEPLVIAQVDADWIVAAAGDVNGDAREDLLFQHRLSGEFAVWLMDGIVLRTPSLSNPSRTADGGWDLVGAADIGGDGKADLVLQRGSEIAVWHMNGASLLRGELLSLTAPGKVSAVADYNGDGSPDLIFRSASGNLSVSFLKNGGLLRSAPLTVPNPGSQWSVVGPK